MRHKVGRGLSAVRHLPSAVGCLPFFELEVFMSEVLTKQDRTSRIKKRIRILKQEAQKCEKELFFTGIGPEGSVQTRGHMAQGGVELESLRMRIALVVSIGYVEEKKVARIKGVALEFLEIGSFVQVDERFWRWPFKKSAIAHGEHHRKVAADWWRDEAPSIIAGFLEELEKEIADAWKKKPDLTLKEAQAIINRKTPEIIAELKERFKDDVLVYSPSEEAGACRAQLAAGPIHLWENFQIAALVNIRFGYLRYQIIGIQKIVGTKPDGLYGRKTRRAVKDLQEALNLPKDKANGIWDEEVMAQFTQQFAEEYRGLFRREYEDESIADAAFIGFLEGLKEGATNIARAFFHFGVGTARGLGRAAKGTLDIFIHPVRTAKGTVYIIFNLDEVAEVLKDRFEEYVDAAHNDPDKFMEMSGEIFGEILFAVVSAKGIDKISKLQKVRALRAGIRRKIPPGAVKRVAKRGLLAAQGKL